MKKSYNLKGSFRWFALFVLLFALAGCSSLAEFMGYHYDPGTGGCTPSTGGGCSFMGNSIPSGGCWRGGAGPAGNFEPVGYHAFMGTSPGTPPNARDMGFATDDSDSRGPRRYRPINDNSSS